MRSGRAIPERRRKNPAPPIAEMIGNRDGYVTEMWQAVDNGGPALCGARCLPGSALTG